MNVFDLRDSVIRDYAAYVNSFITIRDPRLESYVNENNKEETLWPRPLVQMNPAFEKGEPISGLVEQGVLHHECERIFRVKTDIDTIGKPLNLHKHQVEAIFAARDARNYVLTTGTGSGKSLSYIIPIVNYCLQNKSHRGIKAIVVYPMNALCNSQFGELKKFIRTGYPENEAPISFERYTGQEDQAQRDLIAHNPPDILLTNYVMLELLLTRPFEKRLINASQNLRFLVLDELHTYRGRQGADVALLTRRLRESCNANNMICVGTSATMASGGSYLDQKRAIAEVASRLFGAEVTPGNVIGESLRRSCSAKKDLNNWNIKQIIDDMSLTALPTTYAEFTKSEFATWLESTFGLQVEEETERLKRALPVSIDGTNCAAEKLAALTGLSAADCAISIRNWLMAGYHCEPDPQSGLRPFAFRLHQFISRGDAVFSTLEDQQTREFSLKGQFYNPNDRNKVMFPIAFCRECGTDYYTVWKMVDKDNNTTLFKPRNLLDLNHTDKEAEPGFVYLNSSGDWPDASADQYRKLPDDWTDESNGVLTIKSSFRNYLPANLRISPDGKLADDGVSVNYMPQPFRFCLCCGVSYKARSGDSDFGRLSTLAAGGRSTATTILGMSAVRYLKSESNLEPHAQKLLSFTDNRQDASLQSGHFNDFIEVSLLRAAIYKAVTDAGSVGLSHDELAQKVFNALSLPVDLYAREPGVQFAQKIETDKAFRQVLGYRIYRDLRRGWRVTSPNLEQCGLLKIEYPSLDEFCAHEPSWQNSHPALIHAMPEQRLNIVKVLLDFMRRELAIDVEYLQPDFFERLQQQSNQRLRSPWAVDENESMEASQVFYPRSRRQNDRHHGTFISGRSGFGQYLGRYSTFPNYYTSHAQLKLQDKDSIIKDLFRILDGQYLVQTEKPNGPEQVPGYQLLASSMQWYSADGSRAFHDPIRVPNPPQSGGRTNPFFVDFYKAAAMKCKGFEAREHTAQVPYEQREIREKDFGTAKLPVLFCSPTMELGVDIRQLNVVNMRNVPPTPANYAQRSGRAGRSGQPAFVLTYCTSGNSHDQYFFRRSEKMVSGSVTPPRLDLSNEDLVKAHIHAVWLEESGVSLGNSLTDILDINGVDPTLAILPEKRSGLTKDGLKEATYDKALKIIASIRSELKNASWFNEEWLKLVIEQSMLEFDKACNRWRSLFRAANAQMAYHNAIIADTSRRASWDESERLRREAESQRKLLTDTNNISQSDFYSYRYFASEGFLPGYSFPRLPLSAYIPARGRGRSKEEFLSRPRFLAISEFGPRSIIYHEGSRYMVNKVILPIAEHQDGSTQSRSLTTSVKQCLDCGYIHELHPNVVINRCEFCDSLNLSLMEQLLRLQNVSTKRHDRITSDEEERSRIGFEIRSGVRFQKISGMPRYQTAEVHDSQNKHLLSLTYGDTADIWRINLGWRRRNDKSRLGFVLDMEKGYWEKSDHIQNDQTHADSIGHRTQRVVPYVEDRRNCLVIEPVENLQPDQFASFQAAIKIAIQAVYQLEDNELAAEPLPSVDDRRKILIYEAAEGGAGILRQIIESPEAMAEIATEALRICHFNPLTGEDLNQTNRSDTGCEAACYECLMNYANQMDHELLDRQIIKSMLLKITHSRVNTSPTPSSFADHFEALKNLCDSQLERQWLAFMVENGFRLPLSAQKYSEKYKTRPDFTYQNDTVFVYIDGPPHDYPERQTRDRQLESTLEDYGIHVIRFHHEADWRKIVDQFPGVFGDGR